MKTIKVSFKNFWYDFNTQDNIFTYILKHKYNVIIDNVNSEYNFTGNKDIIDNNKVNIFYSGEPSYDKGRCDWGLVNYHLYDKQNYLRFPLYLYYIYDFMKKGDINGFEYFYNSRFFNIDSLKEKTKFCTFIASGPQNGVGQYRDIFVQKLMKYKQIDCPGTRFNNMNRLPGDSSNGLLASVYKRKFIKDYKFVIGFENTSTKDGYEGYTTEKLIEPMITNSIPIYWGNKLIHNEFNTKSFINFWDYKNEDDVINKIIELDNNNEMYIDMMNQKYTTNNDYLNINYLISLLEKIIK